VLGNFEYASHPAGASAIQKAEHWIQSEGVPYDVIEDDKIEAPTDTPTLDRYPLQYSNGTIRYGVFLIIMNNWRDSKAVNTNYVYQAVGNGTDVIVFGEAAKYVPILLDIYPSDVSYFIDYQISVIDYTVMRGFDDGNRGIP